MGSKEKVRALCESLGKYDVDMIQAKFPNLSRYQIAKIIKPYSEITGHRYVDESDDSITRYRKLTTYRFTGGS